MAGTVAVAEPAGAARASAGLPRSASGRLRDTVAPPRARCCGQDLGHWQCLSGPWNASDTLRVRVGGPLCGSGKPPSPQLLAAGTGLEPSASADSPEPATDATVLPLLRAPCIVKGYKTVRSLPLVSYVRSLQKALRVTVTLTT